MSSAVLHLRSLGQLTADTQRPYAHLARAVARLHIQPAVTIDGVPYFDAGAVERITSALADPDPARPAPVAPRRVRPRHPADDPSARPDAPRRHPSPTARSQAKPHDELSDPSLCQEKSPHAHRVAPHRPDQTLPR
jgi:hypothetical protein